MTRQQALQPSHLQPQVATGQRDGADLLSQPQIARRLGISTDTWLRWRKAGLVPEAVVLPSGRRKWRREDIDEMAGEPATVTGRSQLRHTRSLRVVGRPQKGGSRAVTSGAR